MKLDVTCEICEGAVTVKDGYLNRLGYIEFNLSCGHKLFLEVKRLPQKPQPQTCGGANKQESKSL